MTHALLEHGCGAAVEPGATWCLECNSPVVFAGTGLDTNGLDDPDKPAPAPPEDRAQGLVCAGCTRPVPAGATCQFCNTAAVSVEVSLPGGLTVPVGPGGLLLGRLSEDDRVGAALDVDQVSRRHAELSFDGAAVWLEDLGSTNGTWLGGRRIDTRVRLQNGDVEIGLGRRVTVTVHVP